MKLGAGWSPIARTWKRIRNWSDRVRVGYYVVLVAFVAAVPWILWAARPATAEMSTLDEAGWIAVELGLAVVVAVVLAARPTRVLAVLAAMYSVASVVGLYSWLYELHRSGWSPSSLGRLDSLYVAVGTLTTAGTGGISADAPTTRGLLVAQMGTDVVLGLFVLGALAAAMTAREPRNLGVRDLFHLEERLGTWFERILDQAEAEERLEEPSESLVDATEPTPAD